MDSGAIVAVTVTGGAVGDTTSVGATIEEASDNLSAAEEKASDKARAQLSDEIREFVADKGYHSNDTVSTMSAVAIRTYIAEPARGQRTWKKATDAKAPVYANRRRIRGDRGRRLMRKRGELLERSFAHTLDTGGMRRVHLRGHQNILKRVLVHVAGFNLGLVMRAIVGAGKPRCFQGRLASVLAALAHFVALVITWWNRGRQLEEMRESRSSNWSSPQVVGPRSPSRWPEAALSTGC